MDENIYTPPLTRTVYPPIDHLRTTPNYSKITDEDRKKFFTNWNKTIISIIRSKKFND